MIDNDDDVFEDFQCEHCGFEDTFYGDDCYDCWYWADATGWGNNKEGADLCPNCNKDYEDRLEREKDSGNS